MKELIFKKTWSLQTATFSMQCFQTILTQNTEFPGGQKTATCCCNGSHCEIKLFHIYLMHIVVFDKQIIFQETSKCNSAVELAWIHYIQIEKICTK